MPIWRRLRQQIRSWKSPSDPIKHVIVLMLENRSFDQMLGACKSITKSLDDLDGVDVKAEPRLNYANDIEYRQIDGAWDVLEKDPHHDLLSVLKQIGDDTPIPGPAAWGPLWRRFLRSSPQLALEFWRADHTGWIKEFIKHKLAERRAATPQGVYRAMEAAYTGHFVQAFVDSYPQSSENERKQVMTYFAHKELHALHTLAEHFTVCDRWFSSVPGPTWANRFFLHSGNCYGTTIMPESHEEWQNIDLFPQRTVFNELHDNGFTWLLYYHDFPQALALSKLWTKRCKLGLREIEHLESDFSQPASDFPQYVFIEPQYFGDDANDDHPPHNTQNAQRLVAQVYNALRDNIELWNESILIITYDEHGGFYDHVEPPKANQPGKPYKDYFYDRYGVRVPTLLVSPWVEPGVCKVELDHTSIGKYLCDKFGLTPLGNRMKAAQTFTDSIRKTGSPRADTPPRLEFDEPRALTLARSEPDEMSENQRAIAALSEALNKRLRMRGGPSDVVTKPSPEELRDRAKCFIESDDE